MTSIFLGLAVIAVALGYFVFVFFVCLLRRDYFGAFGAFVGGYFAIVCYGKVWR